MTEPVIIDARVAAGHDGLAEISVHVRHPNGAVRDICFPHDAIGPVLDARGITTVDQLIGQPWTVLLEHDPLLGDPPLTIHPTQE